MIPKESGKDKENKGRMAWEIYEMRGQRILIMGIYGPATAGEDKKNAKFYEDEVFEVLEGEATFLRQMTAQEIGSIDMDVSIVMTQNEGGRMIENARAAIETQQYYFNLLMTNPQLALKSRPMAVIILRELGFPDADALLPAYGENPNASPEELETMQASHQAELERQAATGGVKADQTEVLPTR
jgi:hypothetical protein